MSPRRLTGEEQELWARLRRSVRPLARPARRNDAPEAALVPDAVKEAPARAAAIAPPSPPAAKLARDQPPPLVALETRERRRLGRGAVDVDSRIDLHGMTQERAFKAMLAFLRSAQARGHRTVLVITGKRGSADSGRGILRTAIPEWLSRPDMRKLVLGVEEATRRHGGSGALYVRLRRG